MKIIKSLLIVATAIGASTGLHAQQQLQPGKVKTELAKPTESTVPLPGAPSVLVPDAKPFTAKPVTAQPMMSEQAVVSPPSTLTRKVDTKLPGTESISAEKPNQATPVLIEPNIKPVLIVAPVLLKVKENQ